MEYTEIAEELMSLAASLSHLPASRAVWEASGGEYSALVYILDSARGAHPTELCRYMSVSSARISAMLRDLENKHWVVRKKDPADERSKLVFLTEAGRQFITERRGAVLRRRCLNASVRRTQRSICGCSESLRRVSHRLPHGGQNQFRR